MTSAETSVKKSAMKKLTKKRRASRSAAKTYKRAGASSKTGGSSLIEPEVLLEVLRSFENGEHVAADPVQPRQILKAMRAYESGNFSVRMPEDQIGIGGEIARSFNVAVGRHESILKEFSRINKIVGKEGRLSERADATNLPAGWDQHIRSFNHIIDDLLQPINHISDVINAIDHGDLNHPMPLDFEGRPLRGEYLKLAKTMNAMIEKLSLFTEEVIRVAREVGNDGILGGRAKVKGVSGVWKELTDTVNTMADNLTIQVRSIAEVTTSVAKGDLSKSITIDAKGEVYELKNTINTMVGQLSNFAREVSRVAKEVGTEGVLGVQARVEGVSGQWRDLTDNVNTMASNLTNQVREITRVATAVAKGDLTEKIAIDANGEVLQLKSTINTMVDQLSVFAEEVTRVARQVGTDGVLGGQAEVRGVAGTWRDLTETVNTMASNLTNQVRDISRVTTSVADGDLTKKITVEVRGEMLELKNTINAMVDRLGSFAGEVTRVAQEVGTDGKLGGLAKVEGVTGIWRDLTENVNGMANNLTEQVRNIAEVATSVAKGDLTRKITVEARGEILELKNTVNTMVDQLSMFSDEVTRVATEVGSDGTLGTQAEVRGVTGTWRDLTESVNKMASNLTNQVRNIAEVATAVAKGDLSKKITVDAKGEILDLKNTVNTMVDQLNAFSNEVTRVAAEVGTEGKLGGQANVAGVAGIWAELTENVNKMANNLTEQVRDIAKVTKAVAQGDMSQKITVDVKGEINDLKNTINTMVDQLNAFSGEVIRVARDVGTEGKLGGQATVEGVSGVWKDLTDNVNLMATNLTDQVRDIAKVTTAVAQGDLSKLITVDVRGEINDLKGTINDMVNQLNSFSGEVTRVAREVGTEGQLGGQAKVVGASGVWEDLTNNVNLMASNITNQVRDIARVTKAVAEGDLSQKITVEAKGEINDLKVTISTMVDQLSVFAEEVTRVAREVGTEGKLGGQSTVDGVAGVWKDLTDNVNQMASNLTAQVRDIAQVTTAVAQGDLSKKITVDVKGEIDDLKNTINIMVDQLSVFAAQVTRVAREVGTEGKLGGQATVEGVSGVWKDLTDNVNLMASNLTDQVRDIAKVTTAVAEGDLSKKISVEVQGEINDLKNTINRMVDQLNNFSGQVTSLAREVGTEGKLGGQALVEGVSGTWKDLTANVNTMATNLTNQVRNVSEVATAIANGNLTKLITVEVSGEMADLKNTINSMVHTLSTFAEQVTNVAREVGVEGKLGGKADVPGAKGTWRDLTDNVNELAGNLTRQVRAIGEVVNSVTQGDLSGSIEVEAKGEVETLKNNINTMIRSLAETTNITKKQDWLKTNLTDFSNQMQGKRSLEALAQTFISNLCKLLNTQHGAFYLMDKSCDPAVLRLLSGYGYKERRGLANQFNIGESLVGQCALEKSRILITDVPREYIRINSGLGEAAPTEISVLPILFEEEVVAVIELASFRPFSDIELNFLEQLSASVGVVISSITANTRTEELLKESQSLTKELQAQQEELRQSNRKFEQQASTLRESERKLQLQQEVLTTANDELEAKAKVLAEQKRQIEEKNREVELAKAELEEKADQLALTSKYKSQFLANMSHELRTPLNSLLILSKVLADNRHGHLDEDEIEACAAIHSSGEELLALINEVLDMSKVEAGVMGIDSSPVEFCKVINWVKQSFKQIAKEKGLDLVVDCRVPESSTFTTDFMRFQQIIKNLLSNAIKFTEDGEVSLRIESAKSGWSRNHEILSKADRVVSFAVSDTGTGIPKDKFELIFEAFQQADGTTSRKYGGTGLGLSISREIANLLGGEIVVKSIVGEGSTFTLYLPIKYMKRRSEKNPFSKQNNLVHRPSKRLLESVEDHNQDQDFVEDEKFLLQGTIVDDREDLKPGDLSLLIIEDNNEATERVIASAHQQGFKCIVTPRVDVGFVLAKRYKPTAVLLQLGLPAKSGWMVLDRFKHDFETRAVPIFAFVERKMVDVALDAGAVMAVAEHMNENELNEFMKNLLGFVSRDRRNLLILDNDEERKDNIRALIGNGDVDLIFANGIDEIRAGSSGNYFDCILVNPLIEGNLGECLVEVLDRGNNQKLPVILFCDEALTKEKEEELGLGNDAILLRRVTSQEDMMYEVTQFLHREEVSYPPHARELLRKGNRDDPLLSGRKVLIVDDDFRNIFALSSVLEPYGMEVLHAENGKEALAVMEGESDIDVVLMDIMMPEMDGYETTKNLRSIERYKDLPILAVTAKAMKGDHEKCIEAGASGYITKPVDTGHLLSLLRVWLRR